MEPAEIKKKIKNLSGFRMVEELRQLGKLANAKDATSFKALALMLEDCQKTENWKSNSHYLSAVIHSVAQVKSPKTMQLILKLAKNLQADVPAGCIELLASILPDFKRFVMGSVRELVQLDKKEPAFLIGIQTMCNLYLEDGLEGIDIGFLENKLNDFVSDDYLTNHIVELVKTEIKSRKKTNDLELENVLNELLV